MISTKVVVFPVPGGPWTTESSFWFRADSTAFLWDLSSELLWKKGTVVETWAGGGSSVPAPGRAFINEEKFDREFD